jgi:hypothetical protein
MRLRAPERFSGLALGLRKIEAEVPDLIKAERPQHLT